MRDSNRLEANLPTQQTSSARERLIIDRDGVRQAIHILTCQTTAAHYCLYLTGRIGLEEMAESVDRAVDRMLSYFGRPYTTGDIKAILARVFSLKQKESF